ncbi:MULTISPECIES: heme exporter protein CcmB [Methylosinus]|uniref:Heme exporter protein B n=1 Tax=Methylosinus trichosporium (strain ATCC 35070 / NCIMB 11131 / UNIQEM 75 / OB3b) TaxID=595536 RepID=A0A2D2D0K7_METT3|nr:MULTISPECIES: heme exporter protein CcmB [Methylosinus]ATQ68484.1 heme exporter protein CcmB [Methylosinus trichosporium OB3b]OBS53983.1 heme exporter protein CcmB [Methylosinus sp. 3S-1]
MSSPLLALFRRDLSVARRIGGSATMGVVFFLVMVTIVPFAIGPDPNLLARIGPAVLWIAALLASLLCFDRLFQADMEDGSLDLFPLAATPLELVVLVKCAAHWVTTGLPLTLAAPVLGLMLQQDETALAAVTATLLAGTPALTLIGAIGAAATVTLRRGGLLMALLVLPLTIPVLIFGVSAAGAASGGTVPFAAPFAILCAISLASLALCPFAAAAALRHLGE